MALSYEEKTKISEMVEKNDKRYYIYDFLIGKVAIVDSQKSNIIFMDGNTAGQVYKIEKSKIDGRTKNGLKRRLNGAYSLDNSRVVDSYIYYHLFTEDDKKSCSHKPSISIYDFIDSSDDLKDAMVKASKYIYKYHEGYKYNTQNEKEEYKVELIKDIENFIQGY